MHRLGEPSLSQLVMRTGSPQPLDFSNSQSHMHKEAMRRGKRAQTTKHRGCSGSVINANSMSCTRIRLPGAFGNAAAHSGSTQMMLVSVVALYRPGARLWPQCLARREILRPVSRSWPSLPSTYLVSTRCPTQGGIPSLTRRCW